MRMSNSRNSSKENSKPKTGIKSFMNVFRPLREWLGTRPKTSTPISSPILRSCSTMEDINGSIASSIGASASNSTCIKPNGSSSELGHFNRNAQARMSLPIMQQNKLRRQANTQLQRRGQQVARSMGFIYLQHKGETKQASLPNELTTIDTIRALFVCAFPHMLTMEFMSQPNIKIYIYSPSCNIFYELSDIQEVHHESVLRIHHSDPVLPPLALPPQMPMMTNNMGGNTIPPAYSHLAYHHSTLNRMHPRQLSHPQPQQQAGSQSSLGLPMSNQQAHMIAQQMGPLNVHQMMNGSSLAMVSPVPHLSQIPPPKPRRMIPASYTMHQLNATLQ